MNTPSGSIVNGSETQNAGKSSWWKSLRQHSAVVLILGLLWFAVLLFFWKDVQDLGLSAALGFWGWVLGTGALVGLCIGIAYAGIAFVSTRSRTKPKEGPKPPEAS